MRKLLLLLLILILLASFVFAVFETDVYYQLEDITEADGGTSLTNTNNINFSEAKLNNGANFDGSSQRLSVNPATTFTTNLTINMWVNISNTNSDEYLFQLKQDNINKFSLLRLDGSGIIRARAELIGAVKFNFNSVIPINPNVWYMITLVLNGTNASLYINGSLESSALYSNNFENITTTLDIGGIEGGGNFEGSIDDVSILPFNVNQEWIDARWNGGIGSELESDLNSPNFVDPTPPDGNVNYTIPTINFTCGENTHYLWFNNITPPNEIRIEDSIYGNWTPYELTSGTTYYYVASCYNSTKDGGTFSTNSSIRSFQSDIPPIITTELSRNATAALDYLNFSINITDNVKIIMLNITLDNELINLTNMSQKFYMANFSIDVRTNKTGTHNISLWVCDDFRCRTEDYKVYVYGENFGFNSQSVPNNKEYLSIIINLTGTIFTNSNITSVLIYNHTKYSPTTISGTDLVTLTTAIITPNIIESIEQIPFHWEYNISDNIFNTSNKTMHLGDLLLIECSDTYTSISLNISILNETDTTEGIIASNLDQTYQVYDSEGLPYRSFNFTNTTLSNFSICIHPNTTVTTDFLIDYVYNDIHFTYTGFQINLSNVTKTLDLFVTTGTSQITYTVKDTFDNPVEDAYITVEKYDVGTNSYKTVEILRTNIDGQAVGRAILFTAWYRFNIKVDGVSKLIEGPSKLIAATKTFTIDLVGGDWYDKYENFRDINYDLFYNNITKNFGLTWDDPNLNLNQICLRVENKTGNKNVVVGGTDSCLSTTSGTLLTNVGGNTTGQMFIATAFAYISGEYFYLGSLTVQDITNFLFFDNEKGKNMGYFVTFMVVLVMAFIGLWSAPVAIVLGLLGFFLMRALGLIYMNWGVFVGLVVIGGILIYRMVKAK